ncbi:hypothetical protein D3C73_1405310 [compost metagenome]
MTVALQQYRLSSITLEQKPWRMTGIYIINPLEPGINDEINRREVVLDQLLLNVELVEAPVQLLNNLFRLHIGCYCILKHGCQEHAEQR